MVEKRDKTTNRNVSINRILTLSGLQANRAIIIRDGDGGGDGDTCGDNYGDDNTLGDNNDGDGDTYGDGDINAYMRTVIWSTSQDGNICHLAI